MKDACEVFEGILMAIAAVGFLFIVCRALKDFLLCKKTLILSLFRRLVLQKDKMVKMFYRKIYFIMFLAYFATNDYVTATHFGKTILQLYRDSGERAKEGDTCIRLAKVELLQRNYLAAKDYLEKALFIKQEIGDKEGKGLSLGSLGVICHLIGENDRAKKYLEKALAIKIAINDKKGVARDYGNLGTVCHCLGECVKAKEYLGEYAKAKEYHERALAIRISINDKEGEAADCTNLGTMCNCLGQYVEAKEYLKKALAIRKSIGDRKGEANCYRGLGTVFNFLGKCVKAKGCFEKALAISLQLDDKEEEATDYGNLGTVCQSLGEYEKGKAYLLKSLAINQQIEHREGEGRACVNLGTMFQYIGEYVKASDYLEKAVSILTAVGDRKGVGTAYHNLGVVFYYLCDYAKAKQFYEKALLIKKEAEDKLGEGTAYGNLGTVYQSLGDYGKAKDCHEKALAIRRVIGHKKGQTSDYANLSNLYESLGDFVVAKEYLEKALAVSKKVGDRRGEGRVYHNLGNLHLNCCECEKAKYCLERALAISKEFADIELESRCFYLLAGVYILEGDFQEAAWNLSKSVQKFENLREFLGDNDQIKISFFEETVFSYRNLSALFCEARYLNCALYVSELGRARALADLLSTQYAMKNQISGNPRSWVGIERMMKKESNSKCLYVSYFNKMIYWWILQTNGEVHFTEAQGNENIFHGGLIRSLDELFTNSFRVFGILPTVHREDRSLYSNESPQEGNLATFRAETSDEEMDELKQDLSLYYQLIIAPVVNLLDEPEIIVGPYRSLWKVPFAALCDESGKYLSETVRIRMVPSLTTLKFIQDCPASYHSETGALIVGEPKVSQVYYKGHLKDLCPFPCARKEAEMIGRLLGIEPLLGEQATKQAVLESINSVSLIHIAAHGNAERGEIALAPFSTKIPQEEDYLLTMTDIARVQLRAKLVVLSCCHSGRGQIRAEGVVGIARAFLGSGARSVLVALWALSDIATEQFMNHFYENLANGESASGSLHQIMKWMRSNGYSDVRDWAPFMLIGDDVKFDFKKRK